MRRDQINAPKLKKASSLPWKPETRERTPRRVERAVLETSRMEEDISGMENKDTHVHAQWHGEFLFL